MVSNRNLLLRVSIFRCHVCLWGGGGGVAIEAIPGVDAVSSMNSGLSHGTGADLDLQQKQLNFPFVCCAMIP